MEHWTEPSGGSSDGRAVSTAGLTCTITPPVTGSADGSGSGGAITFPIDVNGGRCLDRNLVPLEARNSNIEILALGSLIEFSGKEGALIPVGFGSAAALALESLAPSRLAGLNVRVA